MAQDPQEIELTGMTRKGPGLARWLRQLSFRGLGFLGPCWYKKGYAMTNKLRRQA